MKKRFLSILLAALLLSLLPVSALAAEPMQHLGFSLSGMTLDLINAEDHGGFLRYSYDCTVMFSEAVYQLGSPEYLGYWYGAEEEDMDFPLSDGNGHTLTVTGKWGVEKLEAGQTDVTVPVELDIDADDYAAAPSGTYTGTIVLDALVLGTRASDNEYCYYLEEYATATVKLVIPGYDVNVSNPTGCTITADKSENIREGETVHVSYALDEGYYLQALSVTDADGYSVPLSEDGAFTMPAQNVTVTGATIPPHELTFMKAVGLMQDFDWFTPGADKSSPVRYGDTVNLSVNIDETDPDSLGWSLDHWEVKNPESGQIVELNADGCSFTMPNFKVRAIPVLKYEDPNQPGTGVVDPGTGGEIAPDTDRHVRLYRNDGTETQPQFSTVWSSGQFLTLPPAPFTHPEGYPFLGWATSKSFADKGVVYYTDGATVDLSDVAQGTGLSLYAAWGPPTAFTLTVDPVEIPYGAEEAAVTFQISDLVLGYYNGNPVQAIQFFSRSRGVDIKIAPRVSRDGPREATIGFSKKFWAGLAPGEQSIELAYGTYLNTSNNSADIGHIGSVFGTVTLGTTVVPVKNTVTVEETDGGSVTPEYAAYAEGETVRLIVSPNTKYVLDEGSLTGSYTNGEGATHTVEISGSGKLYSFTMPAYPVTVTASFSPYVSGGNTPEPETYALTGENVLFFDEESGDAISEAAEGQTVVVCADPDSFPAGTYFTGEYASGQVEITVDEAGDGSFTMPAGAVSVTAVLAEQEDYTLLLADETPVALPEDMSWILGGNEAWSWDDTLEAGVLDLNGDGEPDVLLDTETNTAARLPGAEAVSGSVTLTIDYPVPYRYKTVTILFAEGQTTGPRITQQPADVAVPLGEMARTTVVAEGEGLKYQWYGREANGREFKSGLRGDTYSVALVKSKIGRTVWCVITDADGNTVTTREAVLNVAYPDDYVYPTITADAADCFVDAGGSVSVTIAAEGYGELSYQWYILNKGSQTWAKSGIKGVGAGTYSCAMNGTRDGRQIYCVVTDAWGNTATSSTVTIGFDCPEGYEGPSVTVNADDIHTDVDAGEYASVTVTATGPNGDAEGLSYQWYLRADENAPWSRSSLKGDTYSVKMVPSKSGRQVKCVVTDAYGKKAESAVFTLTMVIPAEYADGPQIVTQPESVTVARGEIAATTVAAEGAGLTYQWYGRDPGQQSFWRSSLKTDTYSVKMVPSKSGREVYCVVTDKYGHSVTSDVATLTMAP